MDSRSSANSAALTMSAHCVAGRDRFVNTACANLMVMVLQCDARDERHRYQPEQELPITGEDLARTHIGRSGFCSAQFHRSGPEWSFQF